MIDELLQIVETFQELCKKYDLQGLPSITVKPKEAYFSLDFEGETYFQVEKDGEIHHMMLNGTDTTGDQ